MSQTTVSFAELPTLAGRDLGASDYLEITQDRVNTFADATDDQQWIHTDPQRAKGGPFGGTIAHGFLTLALLIPFLESMLDVVGATTKVNYGLDRVRFTSPVRVGERVRLRATVESVDEVKGGYQTKIAATIEIEGQERPAAVIEFLSRYYG